MQINRRKLFAAPAVLPLLASPRFIEGGSEPTLDGPGPVFLKGFGARLDGVTNDTAAAQRAFNTCVQSDPPRPLIVEGICRLEQSVLIDRRVDTTRGALRVYGAGAFGGFLAAGDFSLFDSRLSHPTAPSSEQLWFDGVRFEALPGVSKATVLSDKFLRIRFNDCEFERIAALSGAKYAQEWQFSRCIARSWSGPFFASRGGYHITSSGSKYQNGGGTVFQIAEPTLRDAGCVGCSFHQDSSESITGSFLRAAIVRGLSVAGLYSEGSHGPAFDLETRALNSGISITGCMFAPKDEHKADPRFFDIRWGRVEGGHASGNYSSGRLHHFSAVAAAGPSIVGDYAAIQLTQRAN